MAIRELQHYNNCNGLSTGSGKKSQKNEKFLAKYS